MDKKDKIKKCAKDLFTLHGFKATSVASITKKACVATGTFYNYYTSKEQIFMDIYLEENNVLKQSILKSIDLEKEPMIVMNNLMILNFKGMSESPILREWYNRDAFQKIEQSYKKENGMDSTNFMYSHFVEVVKIWQEKMKIRKDIDANMIVAIFAALINVDQHKDEVGFEYFPKVVEHLADFTMKGLMVN